MIFFHKYHSILTENFCRFTDNTKNQKTTVDSCKMLLIYKTNLTDNQPISTHFLKMSTDSEDFMFSGINSRIFAPKFNSNVMGNRPFSAFQIFIMERGQ